jgi:[ribosomal protein S18]-alanine N-acetyltransferase
MSAPRLRRMHAADVPAVLDIERTSYTMPWSEITFRGLLTREDAELIVAVLDAQVVGYVICWMVADQAELGNVAVASRHRGRGIGALLVEAALEAAARRGALEIFLEVRPSNRTARELYLRYGFREVGRRKHYYSLPAEDAIVMRRALPAASTKAGPGTTSDLKTETT